MTNKEKSALTQVEYLLFIYREDNGKKFKSTANLFDWDMEAIDTLVKLVKKQNDIIEDSKDITTEMSLDIENICNELNYKNKVIEDMADFMVGGLTDSTFNMICRKNKCHYEGYRSERRTCEKCIKKYFEERNKEENEV